MIWIFTWPSRPEYLCITCIFITNHWSHSVWWWYFFKNLSDWVQRSSTYLTDKSNAISFNLRRLKHFWWILCCYWVISCLKHLIQTVWFNFFDITRYNNSTECGNNRWLFFTEVKGLLHRAYIIIFVHFTCLLRYIFPACIVEIWLLE